MVRVIEAVYENGALKPLADPGLEEGQRVVIEIRVLAEPGPESSLQEWLQVYEGLSEEDIAEVEETFARSAPRVSPSPPERG
ncbi:MAG TPA: antitoxin family protein [Thermoanaerobaculia bacterium]|jgi:Uncharacterized protein conserved in archaea|nr:antitoxin family protein [Thermoanaerobaculia bacterium]